MLHSVSEVQSVLNKDLLNGNNCPGMLRPFTRDNTCANLTIILEFEMLPFCFSFT